LAEVLREPDKPGGLSGDKAKDIFDWADVVFAQPSSELWASALLISARNHSGKKLVVDLDDHIWAVHPMNVGDVNGEVTYIRNAFSDKPEDIWEPRKIKSGEVEGYAKRLDGFVACDGREHFFIRQKRPPVLLATESLLKEADAITTTNEFLAEEIKRRTGNQNVFTVPNCLDLRQWNYEKPRHEEVWIGWCGSVSHYPDLEPLMPVFDELMREYPQLRMQIMGSSFDYLFPVKRDAKRTPIRGYTGDESLYAADYRECGERWPGRMRFDKPVPIQQYVPWMLGNWQSDIGICPILENDFNAAKSELKWVEYSALSVPTVASKCGPYRRTIRHDVDGKLCSSKGAWRNGLSELIEQPGRRRELAGEARLRIEREYDARKCAPKWLDVFEYVLEAVAA